MANPLIDDILNSTDIVDIVSRYVPLKKAGSNFAGCCPFHNEKTPSFMVSPTKQIFKCFGCGKGGNVLAFMQEIERIDFRDAVKEVAKIQHIDMDKYDTSMKRIAADQDQKGKLKRIHTLAQNFFKTQLQNSPQAMAYLVEQRKLPSQLIEQFGIGFAPDKHYELLQVLKTKGFTENDIIEASLAKRNANGESYAFFRNRITFPIFDTMGNVIGFSARVINPEDMPKYLNSAEHKAFEKSKVLYGLNFAKNAIREYEKLIIVEGQMDVLGLARIGIPVGIATSGTSLSDDHIKIIKRYTENIYLLFDNDNAGWQATERALKLFYHYNIFPKIIQLPEQYKDIDDLANEPNGKQIFSMLLEKTKDGFLVVYEHLRKSMDMSSPIDKQKLINTLFELILSVNNLAIQEHYKDILSEKLGFAFEILDTQFKRYKATDGRLQIIQQERKQEKKESYQPEREAILAALRYQNQISVYLQESEQLKNLNSFVQSIAKLDPESLLGQGIKGTLSESNLQLLKEMTLRRDTQLEELTDDEKKHQTILQTINPLLQSTLQRILKNPHIPVEKKQELLEKRKKLH